MKHSTIIITTIVVWIISLIGMAIAVNEYVKAKDRRLSREIDEMVRDVFEDRKYVDVEYLRNYGSYEPIALPLRPDTMETEYGKISGKGSGLYVPAYREGANGSIVDDSILFDVIVDQLIDKWDERYGSLSSLYRIKYETDNDWWNLVEMQHSHGDGYGIEYCGIGYGISKGYMVSCYFPYAVGFKKPGSYNENDIKNAVLESFDFLTTNPKSLFIRNGFFERHSVRRIKLRLADCNNEYYWLREDSVSREHFDGKPLFEKYPDGYKKCDKPTYPVQFTEIDTEDYKVFIAKTQPRTYSIEKKPWNPDKDDRKELWLYLGSGLSFLMVLIVIPLWIIDKRGRKRNTI